MNWNHFLIWKIKQCKGPGQGNFSYETIIKIHQEDWETGPDFVKSKSRIFENEMNEKLKNKKRNKDLDF